MHIKWSKPQHYLPQTVNRQLDRIGSPVWVIQR